MDFLNYNDDFMKRYFDDEIWARLERGRDAAKHLQIYRRRAWLKLFRDVESRLNEDPRAEKAGELAGRWYELWEQSTFWDEEIQLSFIKAWRDRHNWPAEARERVAQLNLEKIAAFISVAMAHHRVKELARFARGRRREPPSLASVEQALLPWAELLNECQTLLDHEPSTVRVQALVSRWNKLWQSTPRSEFRMKAILRDALSDPRKWPPALRPQVDGLDLARIAEFMKQAISAGMKQRYRDSTSAGSPSEAWTNLWQRLCHNVGLA